MTWIQSDLLPLLVSLLQVIKEIDGTQRAEIPPEAEQKAQVHGILQFACSIEVRSQ
jgi:hypothetical protein